MKQPEQYILSWIATKKLLINALLCSIALAVFSFFINYAFPVKAIAFTALLWAAFLVSRNLHYNVISSAKYSFAPQLILYSIIGLQMGIAGAMYYRSSFGMPVLPATIKIFAWVAVCIGITEELIFRGFIQGQLSKINPGFAIIFAALAHATYKACLFISPAANYHYSILLFYTWSLGAFILIGVVRYYSKSILPAILVHAVFDLLVYAENNNAPWWVW
ncbi:CPBP family intramembrane glutamic endopeptidase [Ferruginibacter profundus]